MALAYSASAYVLPLPLTYSDWPYANAHAAWHTPAISLAKALPFATLPASISYAHHIAGTALAAHVAAPALATHIAGPALATHIAGPGLAAPPIATSLTTVASPAPLAPIIPASA